MKSCQLEKENQGNFLRHREEKKENRKKKKRPQWGRWVSIKVIRKTTKAHKILAVLYPPCSRPAHRPRLPQPCAAWSPCIWAGPCGRPSPPAPGGQTETGSQVPEPLAPSATQPVPFPLGLDLWKAAEQCGWKDAVWVWGALNTLHDKISSFQNGELT